MTDDWFDKVDVEALYAGKVVGCDDCGQSPVKAKESGIVCGPILRLISVDYSKKVYRGSMLIIVKNSGEQPVVKLQVGPAKSEDGSSPSIDEPRTLKCTLFYEESGSEASYKFYRYSIEVPLQGYEQMCKYSVDSEIEPHYRFFVPSEEQNFNTISVSCNGFSLSVDTTKFKGSMWYDILRKHEKVRYHVILGGGDQIYSDSINIYCDRFKHWLKIKDPIKKHKTKATPEMKRDLDAFYLQEYLDWFGYGHWKGSTDKSKTTQRCFPISMSTIPSLNIFDDHDIIDGYGSYSHQFMASEVFKQVGKSAFKYYMLFQHHTSTSEREAYLQDPCWVLGAQPGDYIGEKSHSIYTRLGPSMAVLGIDCRTERKVNQVCSSKTYDALFARLRQDLSENENKLDHLLVMLGVPIAYPRLVWLEYLFSSKLLAPLKWLSKKGIFARGLVNEFNGDVELLDDLNDHWCAHHHKRERNALVARLQDFGAQQGVRITILSGDVHLASVGRFRSAGHRHLDHVIPNSDSNAAPSSPEHDVRLMMNVISSAVTNTPPPNQMALLLQNRAKKPHHFDHETDEDAVPLFYEDVTGEPRSANAFMNRRNWSDIIPVANLLQNQYLSNQYKLNVGDVMKPGKVGTGVTRGTNSGETHESAKAATKAAAATKSGENTTEESYPVTARGIVATIHCEKDALSASSETVGYTLPIPELCARVDKLSHVGIKHLNLE
ncbi:uncharacterized protein YGR266W [Kluyveromyces marxianus DMKU3-1042]|uniref:Uncharacterized protein YGR266W n=1 Tax=Kluyveromyces marxianus (strain DMKU3-1042 / BCC 29191 / NBRC 104275) TaxID=1003335 RepID=W0T4X6_KLUMD|nr:uncharacterized protein KLMA_10486 [Kluyveromyces marxianus DMKU3-1042]BAO38108.1 uncharacterized protein YGR266W [Kluyveromyces marxianus DMKU3-1042]